MNKKKILYIVNIPEFFLSHRLALAILAKDNGYEVHVATSYSGGIESIDQISSYGFKCHKVFLERGSLGAYSNLKSLYSIYKVIQSLSPDVLHLLTAKCIIYGGVSSKLLNTRRVIHAVTGLGYVFLDSAKLHKNILKKIVLYLYKISIKGSSTVIFQNRDNMKLFLNNKVINKGQESLIYGSGVDPNIYSFSEELPSEVLTVLFPSRLLIDKGLITFLEAAKILRKNIKIKMVLAGDIDEDNPNSISTSELNKWVESNLVEWLGHVEDMPDMLSKSSIVCLPTYYPEGVPKVLIEAASCGRAIITTDTTGCNEIVHNNYNGMLIPIKSPKHLADAITKLSEDSLMRNVFGKNSRDLVLQKFSSDIVNNLTVHLYLG